MSEVIVARTTILVQDDLLLDVKRVAQTTGVTVTEVINSALKAYVKTQPPKRLPSFTGIVRNSKARNLGRNAKKIARQIVDPYEGSPREGRR